MLSATQLLQGIGVVFAASQLGAAKTWTLKTDADGSGGVTPGDTLTYTVVVQNTGDTTLTNAAYDDTLDPHTTLAAGSVRTTPIARNDSGYSTVGNVQMTVAAPGVLANDNDPDGLPGLAAVAATTTSANGGNVNVSANGSFTYNPAPGFSGSDTFTYSVQDADNNTDDATVSITVETPVWFINNVAGAGGDGRYTAPFNSLAAFNTGAADEAGDYIFIYQGSGAYTGTLTLLDNQQLIGHGVGLTLAPNLSIAAASRPTAANIALGSGNTVRGLNVDTSSGTGISGASVGALTINNVSVANSGGAGVSLGNGALAVTFDSVSSTGGANGVSLNNVTGSFVMNGGTVQNSTGHGVTVSNTSGAMSALTLSNVTVRNAGGNGISLDVPPGGSAAFANVTVSNSTIQNNTSAGLRANIQGAGSIGKIDIGNNFFTDNSIGIDLATNNTANVKFDIHNNPALTGTATQVSLAANDAVHNDGSGPTMEGYIRDNPFIAASPTGNVYIAVWVVSDGDGNITVDISGNSITDFGDSGIDVESRGGMGDVNARIINNTADSTAAFPLAGMFLRSGNGTPGETSLLCVNATGNSMNVGAGAVAHYYLDRFSSPSTVFQIQGLTGSTPADAENRMLAVNTALGAGAGAFAEAGTYTNATCASVSFAALSGTNQRVRDEGPRPGLTTEQTSGPGFANALAGLVSQAGQFVRSLVSASAIHTAYASGETVNVALGALDYNQEVTITFDVTVDAPAQVSDLTDQVCSQGTVSTTELGSTLTDDPDTGTAGDPTCTALQTGTIIVAKDQFPDGSTSFGFTSDIPGSTAFNVTGDASTTIANVPPGSYTVTEDDPASIFFKLTGLSCSDGASNVASAADLGTRTATVNLEPNETVTCTFTDNQYPSAATNAASGITTSSATLNGTVNANGDSAAVTFEYGLTAAYGSTVTADQSPVTGLVDTAVSAAVSGLQPNTTYHFRVVAQSSVGTAYGSDLTFTTDPLPPTVTTGAATSVTASGATLNGTVNANYASTTVTFEYGLDTSYGSTVTADQSPVTGSTDTPVSAAVSGLLPNTTYHYRVVGQNSGGTTDGSDLTFTTDAIPPTVTTDPAASVTASGATLNGTVNANNASSTVTFEYGLDTSYGSTVTADQSPVNGLADTPVSAAVSGLDPNTTYHYRVVGQNIAGTVNGGDLTFTTGKIAPTATTDPATVITGSGATLNGTVNAFNDDTTVTFEYGLDTSYGSTVAADQSPVNGLADTPVSAAVSGLLPNTTYHFRVVATNSAGTTTGGDLTFTTGTILPTVTTDAALAITSGGATLNGTVNANNDSTTVTFEYGLDTSYGSIVTADQSPVTGLADTPVSAAISGLGPNTTYHYRVVGQNSAGTANGGDLTFTTGKLAPTATTDPATAVTGSGATLNGTVNAFNDDTTVTFEYGLDTSYGSTATADQNPITGMVDTAASAAVSGLLPNTTYHFRVVATNSVGTTTGGDLTFTTGFVLPAATTDPATSVTASGATLNGTVNANNDSTAVTFEYGLDTSYGSIVTADQSPVTGLADTPVSAAISGLQPNTTYHYRVVGQNSAGTANGGDLTFTTDKVAPTTTTGPATAITGSGATLNGTVNAFSDSTTVTFEYGLDTSYGSTVTADQSPLTSNTDTAVSAAVSGLLPNTTYHFRAVAQNSVGTTTGSDLTFTTGTILPTVTTDAASAITSGGATLNGTVNANNDNTAVTFEYGLTTAYGSTVTADQSPVAGMTDTAVSAAISGLDPNTTYHYRVVGQNSAGTASGGDLTFTTGKLAPTATTDPASAISAYTATLNGTVNAFNDDTTVTFEYGLDASYGSTVTADQSPVSGMADTPVSKAISGLTANVTYHYRVVASNSVGAVYGADMTFVTALGEQTATFKSIANQDGWTLESSEKSGKGVASYNGKKLLKNGPAPRLPLLNSTADLYVGDDILNRQFRSVLSFNTSSLPDNAVILSVTLKIKRQSLVGTDPFLTHKNLLVDIRKPFFGGSAALAPADFQAAASLNNAGVFNKTPTRGWYRVTLKPSAFSSVNLGGYTQFRLRFQLDDNNDLGYDYLRFFSGNADPAYRPVLTIEYYVP